MSDKPSPKSSASKPAVKTTGSGTPSGTKGATVKSKSDGEADETFDFLEPAQASDEIGRLAHYRVLKVLGRGGMGIVFMAEDTRLHRIIALKVMLPAIAKKAIARDRFVREAHATAAIEHDHIVTIYEVNADHEVPYLAMQFLKGMTLEDWLKAGKTLNVPQIMRIGKEIAKALAAAHACQLIHRDIKPSNIWLDAANKGRVKILDFGLARPTNEETHLTQEGMILGSPAYMSPEQARGQTIDERVDLFSLGCVLYRLCAGKLPFTGKDAMSMLLAITNEEPPPLAQLNADIPVALVELVHQLLAKKPEDRPASAKQVVLTIQNIERDWVASAKTTATRPVRDVAASGQTTQGATIAADHADVDPALEESAITDLELQPAPTPSVTAAPPRSRSLIFAGLGCSLLTVVSIFCCLGIVFSSNFGYVTVTAEDETAKALIEDSGLIVVDHNNKAHGLKIGSMQSLASGGYKVDLTKLPKGVQVEPSEFQMTRVIMLEIKIRFAAPKSAPAIVTVTEDQAKKIQQEWAAYLKRDVVEANVTLGAKMMLIPPGEFLMGSSEKQIEQHKADVARKFKKDLLSDNYLKALQNESPQHRVRISKPFYLSASEVTFAQFSKFVGKKEYKTEPEIVTGGTGIEKGSEVGRKREFTWINPGYSPTKDHPVTNITWHDAEEFCKWLSKKENKVFRLPTEAEWEYACRAGTTTWWSFGDDLKEAHAREFMWYHTPLKLTGNPATPKFVALKKSNGFGLFDMHGNVAEMCSDTWGPTYYERGLKEGLMLDPKGPAAGASQSRVVRGGSFLDTPVTNRSAFRKGMDPTLGYATVGFRIVCEAPLPVEH
jgi:formylglycine-generating enzyme required for sulfatase activity/serine/threonine protein kinase